MKRFVCLIMVLVIMLSAMPALAYEELAKGSKGDAVIELQERLNELGYSVGIADGDFGNKTYNAIVSYQADRGLDATGIVTVELQEMMDKELEYLNSLNRIGYAGTDPRSVVSKYQGDNGLEATGFLDEATMNCIDYEIDEIERMEVAVADLVIVDAAEPDPNQAGNAGRFGYASITSGEIVIPCEWTYLGKFYEGLAYAGKDKQQYGYIDTCGDVVISTIYEDASDFHNGLAAVKLDGKWGYIDKNGNVVIDFVYEEVADFSEGLAAVNMDGIWGYINQKGELVISYQWEEAESFASGSAEVGDGYRYGLINANGEYLLENKYSLIGELSDGLRWIEGYNDKSYTEKRGFVDAKGNIVIPLEWDWAFGFSEGLAPVEKDDKWGYIDKKGNLVIPCIYEEAGDFSEGLAAVMAENGLRFFIDTTGNQIVDTQEEGRGKVYDFSNGLAYTSGSIEHKYTNTDGIAQKYFTYYAGYINTNGEMCIATHPDATSERKLSTGSYGYFGDNGVCAVVLPDAEIVNVGEYRYARISYVNTDGQVVIKDAGWNLLENREQNKENQSLNALAVKAVLELKGNLKNPPSLQMHNISAYQDKENLNKFYFVIDYSATNSLGGYVRNNGYISVSASGSASVMDDGEVFHFKSFINNYKRIGSVSINEVIALMN